MTGDKPAARPNVDPKVYANLIRSVELRCIVLKEFTAKSTWKRPELPKDAAVSLSFTSEEWTQSSRTIVSRVCFNVQGNASIDGADEMVFTMSATFELHYSLSGFDPSAIPKDQCGHIMALFIRRNVRANLWPYIRELISSTSLKMGFPAVVLGVYRVNV